MKGTSVNKKPNCSSYIIAIDIGFLCYISLELAIIAKSQSFHLSPVTKIWYSSAHTTPDSRMINTILHYEPEITFRAVLQACKSRIL